MPLYIMSSFLLPKWVIKKIDKIRRAFLWHGHKGHNPRARYMSLVSWEVVTMPKQLGGLGIKDMAVMNRALIAKILWQYMQPRRPWWMHILPNTHWPWEAHLPTALWKAMATLKDCMQVSTSYVLGNGDNIRFWKDKWLGQPLQFEFPNLYLRSFVPNITVGQVRHRDAWELRFTMDLSLEAHEEEQELTNKLQHANLDANSEDVLLWNWTADKNFKVSTLYKMLTGHPMIKDERATIWNLKAPPRVLIFTWIMLRNRILTVDNLVKRGWHIPNRCSLCKRAEETVSHLFRHCSYTEAVIAATAAQLRQLPPCHYFRQRKYREAILFSPHQVIRRIQITICFVIWRERCRRIFRDEEKNTGLLMQEVTAEFTGWF